jgi:4-diphosphocytidyl-2-C-methyl-D-erythritol kinase
VRTEAAGPDWSDWPAPAKLNLFLRIVGRRADGYHRLQTVFQLLDWGDTVRLRVRDDGAIRRVSGNDRVPEDSDLAVRAARLLQRETGCARGCEIAVDKRIPMGGGFGGGSSDAATVLVALDRLWETAQGADRLSELGLRLGADVPVFVRGGNAWAEGIGEILTPVDLPQRWYLVVDPGVHVPTAELFGAPELTRDAPPTTIPDAFSGPSLSALGNAFEPVLRRREPRIAAALDALSALGLACVTGSGGGCFVAFDAREGAEAAQRTLAGRWNAWVAAGASRSPLLGRLEQMP